ncbi:hypothetical protein [Thioclava sp. SK-1]|nr:hypothetical protein [Thioclava sp. SK-1]
MPTDTDFAHQAIRHYPLKPAETGLEWNEFFQRLALGTLPEPKSTEPCRK